MELQKLIELNEEIQESPWEPEVKGGPQLYDFISERIGRGVRMAYEGGKKEKSQQEMNKAILLLVGRKQKKQNALIEHIHNLRLGYVPSYGVLNQPFPEKLKNGFQKYCLNKNGDFPELIIYSSPDFDTKDDTDTLEELKEKFSHFFSTEVRDEVLNSIIIVEDSHIDRK